MNGQNYRCGWVALMGPPNAGKSTLLNGLMGQKVTIVTPKPQTTRNQIVGILTDDDAQAIFMDTPGLSQVRGRLSKTMIQAVWQSLGQADVIMPVLDAAATINMALSRNGCVMPRALSEIISKHWIFPNPFAPNESEESIANKKAAFKEAGMEYTIKLIDEYRVAGIDGIHLYALNKYEDVTRLVKESGIMDYVD